MGGEKKKGKYTFPDIECRQRSQYFTETYKLQDSLLQQEKKGEKNVEYFTNYSFHVSVLYRDLYVGASLSLKKINALKDANQSCKSFRTIRGPCQVQHIINFYNNDVAITKTKTKTYFNFAIYALTANFRPCQKIHQHRDWN